MVATLIRSPFYAMAGLLHLCAEFCHLGSHYARGVWLNKRASEWRRWGDEVAEQLTQENT